MMDELIQELKQLLSFKDSTTEGDIVILASAEPKMLAYAIVSAIEPDPQRKKAWWNVTMQVLTLPPSTVVWTLREPQFTGQEIFTFNGVEHFMKAIQFEDSPKRPASEDTEDDTSTPTRSKLRVIK